MSNNIDQIEENNNQDAKRIINKLVKKTSF